MPITPTILRQIASPQSCSRGEDIFQDQAITVTRAGSTYTAEVMGTDLYAVTIIDAGVLPSYHCTCPFDQGGACKHVVAVGLAIAAGRVEESDEPIATADTASEEELRLADSSDFYRKVFRAAPKDDREAFLRQLFDKNRELRLQFVRFLRAAEPVPDEVDIPKLRTKVHTALDKVTFDIDDYYDHGGYDRYYDDDYFHLEEWMTGKIEKALRPFFAQAGEYLSAGRVGEATAVLAAVYEGLQGVEAPEVEDYDVELLENYPETLESIFREQLAPLSAQLTATVAPDAALEQSLDRLLGRLTDAENDKLDIDYDLKTWQSWLLALIPGSATARHLLAWLQRHRLLYEEEFPFVVLSIADKLQDEALWLSVAEHHAPNNQEIAERLLERYRSMNRIDDFYRVAKAVWPTFPHLTEFLLNHMRPEEDRAFYVDVLRRHTLHHQSHAHYLRLREFLTPKEREAVAREVRKTTNKEFYVQILATEERYADILDLVREEAQNPYGFHFDRLIEPVVGVYPEECYDILCRRAAAALLKGRGRDLYQRLAQELSLLLPVPLLHERVKTFVHHLVSEHNRLPALKDELRRRKLF